MVESKQGFTFKKNDDILSSMIDNVLLKNTDVNDFTVGSILRTLLESESLELETLYYLQLENLNHAIDESVLQAFQFPPIKYVHAFGDIEIDFSGTLQQDLYIPQGTRFGSTNKAYNQVFQTINEYRVPKGENSAVITVYCSNDNNIGSYGNVPKNTIDTTPDMSNISQIYNPEDFLTGSDGESIEDTKTRFRAYIQSLARGTRQSLEYATMAVPGVTGCAIYETTYGSVVIYAHDANGNLNDNLQEEIAQSVAQYKPAGIQVIIRPVHKTFVNLNVGINVKYEEYETANYLELVKKDLVNYLNSFQAGDILYLNKAMNQVLNSNNKIIRDASISFEAVPDESIRDDAYVPDDSVATVGGLVVTEKYLTDPDIVTNDTYGFPSPHNPLANIGETWKDAAEVTDLDTEVSTLEPMPLYSNYKCAQNEVIRAGDISMYFVSDNEAIPVSHLTPNIDSKTIMTGMKQLITVDVFPQNATNKLVTFTSSNENIISVDVTGMVRALAPGEADLLIRATDDSQITATVHFIVKGEPVAGTNLLLDTVTPVTTIGSNKSNQIVGSYAFSQGKLSSWVHEGTKYAISFDYELTGTNNSGVVYPQFNANPYYYKWNNQLNFDVSVVNHGHIEGIFVADSDWISSNADALSFRADNLKGTLTISHVQFEKGTVVSPWHKAPEDGEY